MSQSAFDRAAQTPITWAVLIFYLTIAMLTFPDTDAALRWEHRLWLQPYLVADGEPWRLISYAFVHGGLLHLLLNSVALAWIGPSLEAELGSLRFSVLYVVAAIGGGLCVGLTNHPLQPVVGGSGALFGMMGAAVALHSRAGDSLLEFAGHHGPRRLLSLIAINLVLGFVIPMISNAGHIGGLIAGATVTMVFFRFGTWHPRLRLQLAVAAAGIGLCMHAVWPVTRWDYLTLRAEAATDPVEQRRLQSAALLSAQASGQLMDKLMFDGDEERRERRR